MEKKRVSCSWRWESHDSPHKSQWLHTTLQELDEKLKAMLTLIEEDGDSRAQRAEIHYKRKPSLIQMVEEFNRSYRCLAEKYDQLRSESSHVPNSGSSTSSSRELQHISSSNNNKRVTQSSDDSKLEDFDWHPESVVEDPDVECDSTKFNFESLNNLANDLMSTEACNMEFKTKLGIRYNQIDGKTSDFCNKDDVTKKMNNFELDGNTAGDFQKGSFEWENTWSELRFQVMALMEENLQHQAELLRRNSEKRESIKELRFQLDRLMGENRALQSRLTCSKVNVKHNHSQISRFKGLILRKLFGGGSP